ncbi:MAG: hypothetical protein OXC81_05510 [Betaproteobacteria bacterium]|nr:hypothetical protein [Betaproteobacteria bacterium]
MSDPAVAATDIRFFERLEAKLHRDFENEPLEDCISHAAEKTISESLQKEREAQVLEFLRSISLDANRPGFAASVFRCLARQERAGNANWRIEIVRSGLASSSLPIRDAAAQAAEEWGDPAMRGILEKHSEPVYWLDEYIKKVIATL